VLPAIPHSPGTAARPSEGRGSVELTGAVGA